MLAGTPGPGAVLTGGSAFAGALTLGLAVLTAAQGDGSARRRAGESAGSGCGGDHGV